MTKKQKYLNELEKAINLGLVFSEYYQIKRDNDDVTDFMHYEDLENLLELKDEIELLFNDDLISTADGEEFIILDFKAWQNNTKKDDKVININEVKKQ